MARSVSELSPKLHEEIVEAVNERYHLVESKITGTTSESWDLAEKAIVESYGFDYTQYRRWCLDNLDYDTDGY